MLSLDFQYGWLIEPGELGTPNEPDPSSKSLVEVLFELLIIRCGFGLFIGERRRLFVGPGPPGKSWLELDPLGPLLPFVDRRLIERCGVQLM